MGGPAVGEARRQPPAIIGSSIPGPLAGDWIQDPPPAHGGSWMRGSSCITCGHHPPAPRAAGSPGTGTLYQKQSKHRHINRVEVGVGVKVGVVVGEVDGESGLKKKVYKAYPIAALSISNDG